MFSRSLYSTILAVVLLGPLQLFAETNQLALSQGVASPSVTSVNLFSNGFTMANPVALSYQTGYRGTVAVDGANSTSFGADLGVGDGQYGLALSGYSNSCDGCEASVRGGLSAIWEPFSFGLGVQENRYTLGFMMNPRGLHRLGLVVEVENFDGSNNNGVGYGRTAFAAGYAMVMPQFTLSMDLSKQSFSNSMRTDDAIMISPGLAVTVDIFSVSLSYDAYLNDSANVYDSQIWFGVAANVTSNIQVTLYGEYVDQWTLMGTYYF